MEFEISVLPMLCVCRAVMFLLLRLKLPVRRDTKCGGKLSPDPILAERCPSGESKLYAMGLESRSQCVARNQLRHRCGEAQTGPLSGPIALREPWITGTA